MSEGTILALNSNGFRKPQIWEDGRCSGKNAKQYLSNISQQGILCTV
jgi:hypothetical protein